MNTWLSKHFDDINWPEELRLILTASLMALCIIGTITYITQNCPFAVIQWRNRVQDRIWDGIADGLTVVFPGWTPWWKRPSVPVCLCYGARRVVLEDGDDGEDDGEEELWEEDLFSDGGEGDSESGEESDIED